MISQAEKSSMYKITLRAKFYCKAGRGFDTYALGHENDAKITQLRRLPESYMQPFLLQLVYQLQK